MKMIVSEKELCKSNEADSSSSKRLGKAIIALLVIAAVLIAALAGAWDMFGTQLTAAMTIEKLDDNLWSMEYKGDYGFDGFLEQGGAKSDAEMGDYIASFLSHGFWKPDTSTAGGNYGCSTVTVTSPDGAALFGRNFDWEECDKMLVHTVPKNGYASIATCNLDFLGFGGTGSPMEAWEISSFPNCTFIPFESGGHLLTGHAEEIKEAVSDFVEDRSH